MRAKKLVFDFSEGAREQRELLGGKGANLAEMTNMGLPVPPGFTITTEACLEFLERGGAPPEMLEEAGDHLGTLQGAMDRELGDPDDPLLVSVRSGAKFSMPGMMDTILNLGLNDAAVEGLKRRTQNPRFAFDSYRRFIQMFGDVVLGVEHHHFEELLEQHKESRGVALDTDIKAEDWKQLVDAYKAKVDEQLGKPFPQDVHEQLWAAIGAVFGSWMNQRAITYRKLHQIPEDWGTAVNVQAMVFGNMGDDCATGVAFTRDPNDGTSVFYGEYLVNEYPELLPTPARAHLGLDAPNKHFDTMLQGRGSYQIGLDLGLTRPYAHMREYVFSRTLPADTDPDVTIVAADPLGAVRGLKGEDGPLGLCLVGGPSIAGLLLPEIDDLMVKRYPVVAGSGKTLFEGAAFDPAAFQRIPDGGANNGGLRNGRVEQPVVRQRFRETAIHGKGAAPVAVLLAERHHRRVNGEPVQHGFEDRVADVVGLDLRHGLAVVERNQHVRRLQVAVDDALHVGVLHRVADGDEELDPLSDGLALPVAVGGDRFARHQLHDEVRAPRRRGARVVHLGDVGVVHHRQGLALLLEARDHLARVHADLDDLERNAPAHRRLLLREIHIPEAAFADELHERVRPDHVAGALGERLDRHGGKGG